MNNKTKKALDETIELFENINLTHKHLPCKNSDIPLCNRFSTGDCAISGFWKPIGLSEICPMNQSNNGGHSCENSICRLNNFLNCMKKIPKEDYKTSSAIGYACNEILNDLCYIKIGGHYYSRRLKNVIEWVGFILLFLWLTFCSISIIYTNEFIFFISCVLFVLIFIIISILEQWQESRTSIDAWKKLNKKEKKKLLKIDDLTLEMEKIQLMIDELHKQKNKLRKETP